MPGMPRWFASPIVSAGFDVVGLEAMYKVIFTSVISGNIVRVLFFNPSIKLLAAVFLLPWIRVISIYQWPAFDQLGTIRSLRNKLILWRSRQILVYDETSLSYILEKYPRKKVDIIGVYTDTDFFKPGDLLPRKPYIFCPGDHLRDESVLDQLASSLKMTVVRTTRDRAVAEQAMSCSNRRIQVEFNIPFSEIAKHYREAALVFINSDSSHVPTGITTLYEALSSNAHVVVFSGKAAVGKGLSGNSGAFFVTTKDKILSKDELERIRSFLQEEVCGARELVEAACSMTVLKSDWDKILG